LHPFNAFTVAVFKPEIGPDDIEVVVSIEISDSDAGMDRRTDIVTEPGLGGVGGYTIPPEVVSVRHGNDVGFAIVVEVGGNHVMNGGQVGIEDETSERSFCGAAAIFIPGAPRDEVEMMIPREIESSASDVGRRLFAKEVACPGGSRFELEPVDWAAALAGDKVEVAVLVDVSEGGLTPGSAAVIVIDVMVFEPEGGGMGEARSSEEEEQGVELHRLEWWVVEEGNARR